MISGKNNLQQNEYWTKIADQEFESMDDEAKKQWEELRRITR